MALIERLTGADPDPTRKIRVHQFAAHAHEIVRARTTVAYVKTYWQMSAADITEFDALIAQFTGLTDLQKLFRVQDYERILELAEYSLNSRYGPITGYGTPADVRAKLGL
mgnify:FL=1